MQGIDRSASFGAWVRGRRRAVGLTQAELAEAVSCAVITVRKIEADERRPSAQIAGLLADALRIEGPDRVRFVAVARAEQSSLRLSDATSHHTFWPEGVPAPLTALVGRDDLVSVAARDAALLGGPARLVTLTGPPGVGKTRVGLAVASRIAQQGDVPVVFVGLEGATDAAALQDAIAAAVAARMPGGGDTMAALRREPVLVVLDNFEQIVDCAPSVSSLLEDCPNVMCLVTSRVRLDVYGEHEVAIEPLAGPDDAAVIDPALVDAWPALDLFVRRARAASRSIVFGRAELRAAAEICQLTEGIPLAIELSAAQLRRQPLDELRDELAGSLGRLRSASRGQRARHETMVDAVRWSYDLLDHVTQRVLRGVVLFPAGFTMQAAAAALDPELNATTVRSSIQRLTDHGLVRAASSYADARFAVFEIVRAVTMETTLIDEERSVDEDRIRGHLVSIVARLGPQLTHGADEATTALLVDEHDNVRWLLTWAFSIGGDARLGAQLVRDLHQFWQMRNLVTEGSAWAHRVLDAGLGPEDEVSAQLALGLFAWSGGDLAASAAMLDAAISSARRCGDDGSLAEALGLRGITGVLFGDPTAAADLDESLALFEANGTKTGQSVALIRLGTAAMRRGDLDVADERYTRALQLAREIDSPWGIATALSNLGQVRARHEDWEVALELSSAGFEAMLRTGSLWYSSTALAGIGHALFGLGYPRGAARCYGIVERVLADLHLPMFPIAAAWEQGRAAAAGALGDEFAVELRHGWAIPMTVTDVDAIITEVRGAPVDRP